MFLLPKVDVDVADLDNITGVSRVLFVLRNSGNVDNHGGHCLDPLRYLVAVIKLNARLCIPQEFPRNSLGIPFLAFQIWGRGFPSRGEPIVTDRQTEGNQ